MSIDPMAKKYAMWSTYTYVLDNPVMFIDPDGKAPSLPPEILSTTIVGRHTFNYNENCRNCGSDYITLTKTTVQVEKNEQGTELYRMTTMETTNAVIDEEGNPEISRTSTAIITTNSSEGLSTTIIPLGTETDVQVDDLSSGVYSIIAYASSLKKATGHGLVEKAANENHIAKESLETVGTAATYGGGVELVASTAAKLHPVVGVVTTVTGVAASVGASTKETNPENITINYKKVESRL